MLVVLHRCMYDALHRPRHDHPGVLAHLHEALDQSGALAGPLLVAAMIAVSGYQLGFAVLAVPGVLAVLVRFWLRTIA